MNPLPRNAFMPANAPSLQTVLDLLSSAPDLSENRLQEMASGARTLARWADKRPGDIPAHPDAIRRILNRLTPAAVGVRKKRFANVKSAVLAALRHFGFVAGAHYLTPLSPEWRTLYEGLPGKYAQTSLSRFFHFCSASNIFPGEVDDAISNAFLRALIEETFIKDPRVTHQNACRAWNRMIDQVPGWPKMILTVPRYADHYVLLEPAFPSSFIADCDAFLDRQSSNDPLDLDAPPRPLRPRTISAYR